MKNDIITNTVVWIVAILTALVLAFVIFGHVDAQTIPVLPQFTATSSPTTAITQTVYGRAIKITGLSSGCLGLDSDNLVTSSGSACGSGGGGGTPGGASSTIQFNANGAFAGSSYINTDGTNLLLGTNTPATLNNGFSPLQVDNGANFTGDGEYAAPLLANGYFTTNTNWTPGVAWTSAYGYEARFTAATAPSIGATYSNGGNIYTVAFVNRVSGNSNAIAFTGTTTPPTRTFTRVTGTGTSPLTLTGIGVQTIATGAVAASSTDILQHTGTTIVPGSYYQVGYVIPSGAEVGGLYCVSVGGSGCLANGAIFQASSNADFSVTANGDSIFIASTTLNGFGEGLVTTEDGLSITGSDPANSHNAYLQLNNGNYLGSSGDVLGSTSLSNLNVGSGSTGGAIVVNGGNPINSGTGLNVGEGSGIAATFGGEIDMANYNNCPAGYVDPDPGVSFDFKLGGCRGFAVGGTSFFKGLTIFGGNGGITGDGSGALLQVLSTSTFQPIADFFNNQNVNIYGTASTSNIIDSGITTSAAGSFVAVNATGQLIATTTPSGGGGSGTVSSGTTGQMPYYASNGTTLTATSTVQVLTNSNVLFGTSTTASGAFVFQNAPFNRTNQFFGIYDSGNSAYYGISSSLPAPTVGGVQSAGLGGYYSGVGVGGFANNVSSQPIFGVLASNQSGNGIGNTDMTVLGNGTMESLNNVLDSGIGQGYMGIGSSTPGSYLAIGSSTNYINFVPNATSTLAYGENIKNGCYAINGTCLSTSGGGGSGTVNSGTVGSLAYYPSTGTAVSATTTTGLITLGGINSTGSATSTFAGPLSIENYIVATSTTVCIYPQSCQYQVAAGTTNADIQINAALTAVANAGGGMVNILPGLYKVSQNLNVGTSTIVMGSGYSTEIQPTTSGLRGFFMYNDSNVTLEYLHMDGTNQTSGDKLFDIKSNGWIASNVRILYDDTTNSNSFSVFSDSNINSVTNQNYTGTTTQILIQGDNFNCNDAQDCIGGGPGENPTSFSSTTDITITDTQITKSGTGGEDYNCIDLTGGQYVTFGDDVTCTNGQVVLGNEANPNLNENIHGLTLNNTYPNTIAGQIVIDNTHNASIPAGHYNIYGNNLSDGNIEEIGNVTEVPTDILAYGNEIQQAPSSWTYYNTGITGEGATSAMYFATSTLVSAYDNDIIAAVSGSGTGIWFSNDTNSIASDNTITNFAVGINGGNGSGNKSELENFVNDTTNEANFGNNILAFTSSGFLGIGTTSPSANLSVGGASTTLSVMVSKLIGAVNYMVFEIDQYGHDITSGPTPTVTGGTSSVVGNDNNGTITVTGTALTSVTLNFARTWSSAPDCTESDNSTALTADITSISTTQVVFGFSIGVNSGTVWYQCRGHQ